MLAMAGMPGGGRAPRGRLGENLAREEPCRGCRAQQGGRDLERDGRGANLTDMRLVESPDSGEESLPRPL